MSGPQDIAAILGLIELGFRSISTLYQFIQELRHIPTRIEQVKVEIRDLLTCLDELYFIQAAEGNSGHIIERSGLGNAIDACGKACNELHALLSTWDPLQSRFSAKLRYFLDKEAFDYLVEDIASRKQTTILAVVVTQLSMQAESDQKSRNTWHHVEKVLRGHEDKQHSSSISLEGGGELVTYNRMSTRPGIDSASRSFVPQDTPLPVEKESSDPSDATQGQVFGGDVKVGGSSNEVGMPASVAEMMAGKKAQTIQHFKKTVTTSDGSNGNKIGIFHSK
ncbi:hypothetical protein FSARC_3789 [Fusarium sarcochroum]|uniref:Azaphilone pigments biosynthesis cluster protein L N-terminal domain-containing protein n=1 Tax=Fusarium sarcochroum TaxID=1208366 RepID=A0A8H4U3N4_9HYPO|nr:hypothetical protein FSARC_3789 [Fusarium sarcochroum]